MNNKTFLIDINGNIIEPKDLKNKFILVLDHDGIIHPNELIEEYVKKIDYRASDEYRLALSKMMDEREPNEEELSLLIREHYFMKDQVLEEVKEEFKGKIPYDLIYTFENAYEGVLDTIRFVYVSRVFDAIILNSHQNCQFEIDGKERFHKYYLPFLQTFYPPFHKDKFDPSLPNLLDNNDRVRTHKGIYLMEQLGVTNLKGFYAVDDGYHICKEYNECGAKSFYKAPGLTSSAVIMQAASAAYNDRRKLINDEEDDKGRGAYRKVR